MSAVVLQDSGLKPLLEKMVTARQLSASDAEILLAQKSGPAIKAEEDVLRWLAKEYGLAYTTLEDIEPDQHCSRSFPRASC